MHKRILLSCIRILCCVLCASLLTTVLVACNNSNDNPSDSSADVISEDSSMASETSEPQPHDSETGMTVTFGSNVFSVNAINAVTGEYDVVIYDRDMYKDGFTSLYAPENHNGRYVIVVKMTRDNESLSYSAYSVTEDANAPVCIPVNGFVISIDKSALPDKFSVRKDSVVYVKGYYPEYRYERFDLATASPDDITKTRRIGMLVPEDGNITAPNIYLADTSVSFTVPENGVAVIFGEKSVSTYTVESLAEPGQKISGKTALIFTGEYNSAYARQYFKTGKVKILKDEALNNITDNCAVTLNGNTFVIGADYLNSHVGEDGIFVYTSGFDSLVSHARKSFIDIVVVNDKIAYIGKENTTTLIPCSDGYVVSFAGSEKSKAASLSVGDAAQAILIEDSALPNQFVKINGIVFELSAIDGKAISDEGALLYSSLYTESTGSLSGTTEIAFSDGKVIAVSTEGNTNVPENGYILSIPTKERKFVNRAKNITVGDSVLISFAGSSYGFTDFKFTAINGVRMTDYIVVYDGTAGKSTKTNIYGYEVAVNASGMIIETSYAGDMTVPENGYVISAHGAGVDIVKNACVLGATAELNKQNKTISVTLSPEIELNAAISRLKAANDNFKAARDAFISIDLKSLSERLNTFDSMLKRAETDFSEGRADKASELSLIANSALDTFGKSLYESAPVENRSVWYRAVEKSDDEVYATVKLMSEMNINAVYLETWYNGMVIGYSDNPLVEHNAKVHGEYDALDGFVRICHEYGIEVHIWVENFFIGFKGGSLVEKTKEHHLLDREGRDYSPTMYGDFVFLNPYDSFSQELVMGIYKEIIEKYDIDGINLDYIRYPDKNGNADFGYNDDIIKAFQKEYSTTVDPRSLNSGLLWENWCLFREEIINDWVRKIYETVIDMKPSLSISCAVSNDYPGSRTTIFQNFKAWVDAGYIDEVFSMSYTSDLDTPARNISTFMGYTGGKAFYSIGLSAFETTPADILVAQVQVARDKQASGENLFSWGSLIEHTENYFTALKNGVYSAPSVRTDKLSVTVSAYADRLKLDMDNVYSLSSGVTEDFRSSVNAKLSAVLASAEAFNPDKATVPQKKEYCSLAITELNELIDVFKTCDDKKAADAMVFDAEFIIECLKTSLLRAR